MSAAPYNRIANSQTTFPSASRLSGRTNPAPRVRIKTRVVGKNNSAVYVLRKVMLLGVFTFVGFVSSTIVGQVMLEKVRHEGIATRQLLVDAHKTENTVRHEVDSLTNPIVVEEWAETHGFVAPEAQVEPKDSVTHGPGID